MQPPLQKTENTRSTTKCFYCFPKLTLKYSLCKQANIVRFLHFLDGEKWSFLPSSKSCHLHHTGKKTLESWKSNFTIVYFLMKTPSLPLLSKTSPQNTCFLIIACTVLTPHSERVDFWFPESFFTSLSCQLQERLLNTWFQIQPTKKHLWRGKKCRWLNRKIPTHFTLHCMLSLYSLLWRSHTSYYSHLLSSFTHWAPDSFATPLTPSALLPTLYSLQVLGYSWTLLQPVPLQYIFTPAAYFHFRQSLRHCPWHLQPNNTIAFSPTPPKVCPLASGLQAAWHNLGSGPLKLRVVYRHTYCF